MAFMYVFTGLSCNAVYKLIPMIHVKVEYISVNFQLLKKNEEIQPSELSDAVKWFEVLHLFLMLQTECDISHGICILNNR